MLRKKFFTSLSLLALGSTLGLSLEAVSQAAVFSCPNCQEFHAKSVVPLDMSQSDLSTLFQSDQFRSNLLQTSVSISYPQPLTQQQLEQQGLTATPTWQLAPGALAQAHSVAMQRATFSAPFWNASQGFDARGVRAYFGSFLPPEFVELGLGTNAFDANMLPGVPVLPQPNLPALIL
jgi:hypothetical protein